MPTTQVMKNIYKRAYGREYAIDYLKLKQLLPLEVAYQVALMKMVRHEKGLE